MAWATFQLVEVGVLALIAGLTHVLMVGSRRPFLEELEGLAGGAIRALAAISDIVATLLYIGFVAAAVPFDGLRPVGSQQFESALDTVALFAVFVAAVQLVSLVTLYRVAHNLEPWPAEPVGGASE